MNIDIEPNFWAALEREIAYCREHGRTDALKRLFLIWHDARSIHELVGIASQREEMRKLERRLKNYELPDRRRYSGSADAAPGVERAEAILNGVAEGLPWWGNDELADEEGDPVDGPLPSERFYGPRDPGAEAATDEEPPVEEWDGAFLSGEVDANWLWLMSRHFKADEEHGAWFDI